MSMDAVKQPPIEAALWTEKEVAAWARLSVHKLRKMRASGIGPRWVSIGRNVRYPVSDARDWLASLGTGVNHAPR